jgi:hypothetical protein
MNKEDEKNLKSLARIIEMLEETKEKYPNLYKELIKDEQRTNNELSK